MSRAKRPEIRAAAFPPRGSVYVVVDATADSTLGDVLFQTDAAGFILQLRGGLSEAQHPAFHADPAEAEADAYGRIFAARAASAITGARRDLRDAARLEVRKADGSLLFGTDLGGVR